MQAGRQRVRRSSRLAPSVEEPPALAMGAAAVATRTVLLGLATRRRMLGQVGLVEAAAAATHVVTRRGAMVVASMRPMAGHTFGPPGAGSIVPTQGAHARRSANNLVLAGFMPGPCASQVR